MPFDGGFLHKIKQELEPMIGARVDKIGQPNRDCVVIHLHNRGPVRRLVILAGAAPRLHFSAIPIEYPATPPMFCLLLRKHLGGGRLTAVTQQGLDRVLTLHFEATNELGDRAKFRLVCERAVRLQELEKSAGRDQLRLYGDLLSANLYRLEKGMTALTCEDYTADPPVNVTIPLEGRLAPSRNVQKYYTEYRKAANAEAVLRRLITECEEEIAYIESVQEALRRATTEGELLEIREELRQQGYLKTLTPKGQKPLQKRRGGTLPPLRYRSSDGYTILCGRNNLQNDQLTLKTAHGSDLWFHIQKQPGSHVILLTGGTPLEELPDQTIEEAAMLAACNSSGRESSRVPIDYTLVKNIKKPNGARPGMVIYETYYTMLTTPDHAAAQKLLEK